MQASGYFSTQGGPAAAPAGPFRRLDDVPPLNVAEGRLPRRPGSAHALSFVSFAPHTEAPRHTHAEEQAVIVLDGEIEFDLDGEVRTLRQGDVVGI